MSACRTCLIVTIRLIQTTCALAVIAFGAWTNHIINSLRKNINKLLDKVLEEDSSLEDTLQRFFNHILQTPKRVYFAIAAGSWAILAILLLVIYKKYAKSTSRATLIGIELLTCLIMLGAFISITTFAVQLLPMCILVDTIPPLVAVVRVCPVSKAWVAALALGLALFIITLIGVIVSECCGGKRKQKQAIAAAATHMTTTTYDPKAGCEYQVTPASPMTPPSHRYQSQQPQAYFGQQQQGYFQQHQTYGQQGHDYDEVQQGQTRQYDSSGGYTYSTPKSTSGPYEPYKTASKVSPTQHYPRKPLQSQRQSQGYFAQQ